jgi:hypothetical protein
MAVLMALSLRALSALAIALGISLSSWDRVSKMSRAPRNHPVPRDFAGRTS